MFGFKNNNSVQKAERYSAFIHTMQDDLSSKQPAIVSQKTADTAMPESLNLPLDKEPKKESPSMEDPSKKDVFSNKENNSPFLPDQQHEAVLPKTASENIALPKKSIGGPLDQKHSAIIENIPIEKNEEASPPINWLRIITGVFSVCIIAAAGFAGYYFLATPKDLSVGERPIIEEPVQQISIDPVLEKFSSENPNYLPIDISSSASADTIQNKLFEIASEVSETQSSNIFEFVVTDANNNPVAFPIFAIAAKIDLPQEILKQMEETFSLYIYNENNVPHIGLAASTRDEKLLKSSILERESSLINDLAPLLLGKKPQTIQGEFKNGEYGAIATRFKNFNEEQTLSIDYTVTGNVFYIATSKNTLRAIIDKHSKPDDYPNKSNNAD